MKELDDGRYNKVANIIGHTMKYHPHGDASIGDALVPGFWDFNGQGYLWVPGYWAVPPAYHRNFVAAHWAYRGGHYVYYRGYWR